MRGCELKKMYGRRKRLCDLPTEVLQSIFCRLEAKTIFVGVRSVCKTWYGIVTHPNFISMHAQWWAHNRTHYLLDKYPSQMVLLDQSFDLVETLQFPIPSLGLLLVGSCNGLVCLREAHNCTNQLHFPSTYLWNPCIKNSFKKLPPLPWFYNWQPLFLFLMNSVAAFGFDSRNNDYKVFLSVKGKKLKGDPMIMDIVVFNWVYSLKTDSWKPITAELDGFLYPSHCHRTCRTYFDGVFYWTPYLRIKKQKPCIFWFDFCDETIHKTEIPVAYDYEMVLSLVNLNNSLVVFISDFHDPQKQQPCLVNAWVMKKTRDQAAVWSWDAKLSTLIPASFVMALNIRVVNGEILLLMYGYRWGEEHIRWPWKFGVYDFKQQRIREVDFLTIKKSGSFSVPSFVSHGSMMEELEIHYYGSMGLFSDSFTYSESLFLLEDAYRRPKQFFI